MDQGPITIQRQGSFFVGGKLVTACGSFDPTLSARPGSEGQSFWIDQMYVQYQIPIAPRALPLVFVHGGGGTGRVWETTPDGREGYQTIFLRRGFAVYIVDSPRGGRSGFPSFDGEFGKLDGQRVVANVTSRPGHQQVRSRWRLEPDIPRQAFPVQALDQFHQHIRPMVSDDVEIIATALLALLDRIGPAVIVTHSNSGVPGWLAGCRSSKVRGIVSYEPDFVLPEDELPQARGIAVSQEQFRQLSTVPLQVVYGDNIPGEPVLDKLADGRRAQVLACNVFVATLRKLGGKAGVLHLPEVGLAGNSHFMFSDLNNLEVADQLSVFLAQHKLDTLS